MTFQIPDHVRYNNELRWLVSVNGEGFPHPGDFGLKLGGYYSTGLRRGYIATYSCANQTLYLEELIVSIAPDTDWIEINGVMPEQRFREDYDVSIITLLKHIFLGKSLPMIPDWGRIYKDLNIRISFTGGMILGGGERDRLHDHHALVKPYQFKQVHELLFHDGNLIQEIEHTEKIPGWLDQELQHRAEEEQKEAELREAGFSEDEIRAKRWEDIDSGKYKVDPVDWGFTREYNYIFF